MPGRKLFSVKKREVSEARKLLMVDGYHQKKRGEFFRRRDV